MPETVNLCRSFGTEISGNSFSAGCAESDFRAARKAACFTAPESRSPPCKTAAAPFTKPRKRSILCCGGTVENFSTAVLKSGSPRFPANHRQLLFSACFDKLPQHFVHSSGVFNRFSRVLPRDKPRISTLSTEFSTIVTDWKFIPAVMCALCENGPHFCEITVNNL